MHATPSNEEEPRAARTPATKPFDPELRTRLSEYRTLHNLSNAQLGAQIGVGATQISKYLNGSPEGDVERLERAAADVMKNALLRVNSAVDLFASTVTDTVAKSCETIRKTNDVGLIYGPAGIGKTCGIALYLRRNPSAIGICMTRWARDIRGLTAMIFATMETRGWSGQQSRGAFIAEKLKGSNRLVLIDNAHRLSASGLQWIFDMHDETGAPFALLGNPEVLDVIRKNDQMFSRIGLKREVSLKKGREIASATDAMLAAMAPAMAAELRPLALQVVTHQGHMRSLRKQLSLMSELLANNPAEKLTPAQAFAAAHTRLVREYDLNRGTVGGAE